MRYAKGVKEEANVAPIIHGRTQPSGKGEGGVKFY